jgi:signal transduction histidine kinase
MSLQRKFAVLIMVMALAVFVNLGLSLWTLRFAQGELVRPLLDIQMVLPGLSTVKQEITLQAALLGGDARASGFSIAQSAGEAQPERFGLAAERALRALTELEALDQYTSLVGISTSRNLHARIRRASALGRSWFDARVETDRTDAIEQFKAIHDLIERMESSVTRMAGTGTHYASDIRVPLLLDLMASLAIVVLTAVLGVILLRRWVTRPVGFLREATDRLAKGDFSHRVPVVGQDELGHLSAEVNHMAGMISSMQEERVDRERLAAAGEVLRRLAHNLRNPLAGIRSLAELTRGDLPPLAPARENQDRILQTVDRFERWLADVLSATTPLKIVPQTISVKSWLTGLVEPLRPAAAAKGIDIRLNTEAAPETAVFDPRHLEQAVVAVVTNAIQASPRGAPVQIDAAASDGPSWEIRVSDRGPGVPPDLSEKIFKPYFTTKRDGTGIGLALAKQVTEQHAGRIRVAPASEASEGVPHGTGARFVFSLPLAGPPELANTGQ